MFFPIIRECKLNNLKSTKQPKNKISSNITQKTTIQVEIFGECITTTQVEIFGENITTITSCFNVDYTATLHSIHNYRILSSIASFEKARERC